MAVNGLLCVSLCRAGSLPEAVRRRDYRDFESAKLADGAGGDPYLLSRGVRRNAVRQILRMRSFGRCNSMVKTVNQLPSTGPEPILRIDNSIVVQIGGAYLDVS